MAHPNLDLVHRFYAALAARDAEGMAACYHPRSTFRDPVFGELDHDATVAMWRMLCERGKDLVIVGSGLDANDAEGRAHWDASYTYTATGRHVENHIDARFTFGDGLIVRHVDTFDLYRWMRQALGLTGVLVGWTPFGQRAVRTQARETLARYRRRTAA